MTSVDGITHGLADAVSCENGRRQVLAREQLELLFAIILFAERALHLEVVAPAGQLQPLIAPFAAFRGQLLQGQVRP